MKELLSELIIYNDLKNDPILGAVADVLEASKEGSNNTLELKGKVNDITSMLLEKAAAFGAEGNLWKNYVAYLLVYTENFYSFSCEGRGRRQGSIDSLALSDMKTIKKILDYDFSALENALSVKNFTIISSFNSRNSSEDKSGQKIESRYIMESGQKMESERKISKLAAELSEAANEEDMLDALTSFYKEYGVGDFGLNRAFRISTGEEKISFVPISDIDDIKLSDLVGYEVQKQKLIENTEAFMNGKPANNCLLFGDAGTGKSSSVKALINEYYDEGLRMIELYKHEMKSLSKVISILRNRNYKFIIYMDDLSFEDFEVEYKYLKAVIEGGLEKKADNVLIYATSNRRNIIKETWKDLDDLDMDKHSSDTMQEKLSLVSRFGITISYMNPNKKLYDEIVLSIASRYPDIKLTEEELLELAHRWEISHGGFSGRTARQFVDHILGTMNE